MSVTELCLVAGIPHFLQQKIPSLFQRIFQALFPSNSRTQRLLLSEYISLWLRLTVNLFFYFIVSFFLKNFYYSIVYFLFYRYATSSTRITFGINKLILACNQFILLHKMYKSKDFQWLLSVYVHFQKLSKPSFSSSSSSSSLIHKLSRISRTHGNPVVAVVVAVLLNVGGTNLRERSLKEATGSPAPPTSTTS